MSSAITAFARAQSSGCSAQVDEDDFVVEGYKEILPDGSYEARYLGHETAVVFGHQKVFLKFQIVQFGPYMGKQLFRAFRARGLKGKLGKGGKFVAYSGGDLYITVTRLLDVKLRTDRISLKPFRNMLFRVTTRTVTKDYRQRDIPEPARYSVIDNIERGE